jgi:hypothetical protein
VPGIVAGNSDHETTETVKYIKNIGINVESTLESFNLLTLLAVQTFQKYMLL